MWRVLLVFGSGLLCGFLLELLYRSFTNRKIIMPLLINSQMYGASAVFLYLLSLFPVPLILRVVLIAVFTTAIEYIIGYAYLKAKGIRLWDYSGCALNYRGLVCLKFSIYWLVLSLAYYHFVLPLVASI